MVPSDGSARSYGTLIVPQRSRRGRACFGHGPSLAPAFAGAEGSAEPDDPTADDVTPVIAAITTATPIRALPIAGLSPMALFRIGRRAARDP